MKVNDRDVMWIKIYLLLISLLALACVSTPSFVKETSEDMDVASIAPVDEEVTPLIKTAIERTPLDQSPTSELTPQSSSTPTLPEKAYVIIEVAPHATLSSDQQENYWNGVIQENRGCALPCVFGITPGHSTWQPVFELYSPFLQATVQYPLSPNMTRFNFGIMFNQDMSINPHMTLLEKNGIVQSVYLQFLSLHSPEAPYLSHQKLDEAVQAYSIDKILDRYGQPSQVLLGLQDGPYEPGAPWPYSIWLLYEKEAFLIVYHFEDIGISRNNEALTVCPVHHALKDLELFAGEPNNQFSLDHFVNEVKGDQWLDQRRDEKAIQFLGEATDLTPESFFETFRSPGNSGCFVSPLDRWTHHSS